MSAHASAPLTIRSVIAPPDLDQVRRLLREYNTHLRTVIGPALIEHRESELAGLPGSFAPPRGALLLATAGDEALGCAALRPLTLPGEPSPAEFCRLWVTPHARGRALGGQLLQHAITAAREAGHTALLLNSVAGAMDSAQALYARAGFVRTLPYKHVAIPHIEFFRLDLTS